MKKPILTFALALFPLSGFSADPKPAPPNVILIISDDMGYADLPGFGADKEIKMPNMDRLRASGMAFTDAYVTAPVCVPSRMGIMTGRHQSRWGVYNLFYGAPAAPSPYYSDELHAKFQSEKFIPQYFKEAGYQTALIGKWHLWSNNHDIAKNDGMPDSFRPENKGFDEVCIIPGGMAWFWPETKLYYGRGIVKPAGKYLTDLFGDLSGDFIRRAAKGDAPFYLNLGFNAVHAPLHALDEDIAAAGGLEGYDKKKYKTGLKPEDRDPVIDRRIYRAMMIALDRNVGKVLDALEETGASGNTLIAFVNDNGGPALNAEPISYNAACNDPYSNNKYDCYEGGVRVPMIVSWPGHIPAGKTFSGMVSSMDLLPTMIEAAGLTAPPRPLDGVSLLPFLRGDKQGDPHEWLAWQNLHGNEQHPHQAAIRRGKWKLLQETVGNQRMPTDDGWRLFDLEADPGEKNNLAAQFPEVVAELEKQWFDWRSQMTDGPLK